MQVQHECSFYTSAHCIIYTPLQHARYNDDLSTMDNAAKTITAKAIAAKAIAGGEGE